MTSIPEKKESILKFMKDTEKFLKTGFMKMETQIIMFYQFLLSISTKEVKTE